ncbi:hypothetical protein HK100_012761, partial [Physocladia obscura]
MKAYATESDRFANSRMVEILESIFKSENPRQYFKYATTKNATEYNSNFEFLLQTVAAPLLAENLASLSKVSTIFRSIGTVLKVSYSEYNSTDVRWYMRLWIMAFSKTVDYCDIKTDDSVPIELKVKLPNDLGVRNSFNKHQENDQAVSKKSYHKRDVISFVSSICDAIFLILSSPNLYSAATHEEDDYIFAAIMLPLTSSMFKSSSRIWQITLKNVAAYISLHSADFQTNKLKYIFHILLHIIQDLDQKQANISLAFKILPLLFRFKSVLTVLDEKNFQFDLSEAISSRLYDMEWDIRVAAIGLIEDLLLSSFEDEFSFSEMGNFSKKFVLPISRRLKDAEPNVRLAALHFLTVSTKHSIFWDCLDDADSVIDEIISTSLENSEAIVRRGAVEFLIALASVPSFDFSTVLSYDADKPGKI